MVKECVLLCESIFACMWPQVIVVLLTDMLYTTRNGNQVKCIYGACVLHRANVQMELKKAS